MPARAPGRLALLSWRASLRWQAGLCPKKEIPMLLKSIGLAQKEIHHEENVRGVQVR
jgi:hypothetical protein